MTQALGDKEIFKDVELMQTLTATQQISIVKLRHSPNSSWLEYLLCSLILLSKQLDFMEKRKELLFPGAMCPERLHKDIHCCSWQDW